MNKTYSVLKYNRELHEVKGKIEKLESKEGLKYIMASGYLVRINLNQENGKLASNEVEIMEL